MLDFHAIKMITLDMVSNGEKSAMKIFEDSIPKCDITSLSISVANVHGGRAISGLLGNIYPGNPDVKEILRHAKENIDLADEGVAEFARRCKCKNKYK